MSEITTAVSQDANILPPRVGQVIALAIDATARAYDITVLSFNGEPWHAVPAQQVYLTLRNDSAATNIYYQFGATNTASLDPAAAVTAGVALAYANTYGDFIPPGGVVNVRIHRDQDKFLVVRTATGTSTLRFYASSESSPMQAQ